MPTSQPTAEDDCHPTNDDVARETALEVLRAVDFDWTLHLASVWSPPQHDVERLHAEVRRELLCVLDRLVDENEPRSPLGQLIVGSGGTGKTHLLAVLRQAATRRGCAFVLVEMSGVRDFPATVLQGFVESLAQPVEPQRGHALETSKPQSQLLLERLLETLNPPEPVARIIEKLAGYTPERLGQNLQRVFEAMARQHPTELPRFQDAVRALVALNSQDISVATLGAKWLQSLELDTDERKLLGFVKAQCEPFEILRALSWLMSLCGPTVVAFDQLDSLVNQLQLGNPDTDVNGDLSANANAPASAQTVRVARSIVEQIAGGLSAMRDATRRTLIVVSCVESTLEVLRQHALRQDMERFESPLILGSLPDGAAARSVIAQRLAPAFARTSFVPPWPTWPFHAELFDDLQGISPRELLLRCADHRRACLLAGAVSELTSFATGGLRTSAETRASQEREAEAPGVSQTVESSSLEMLELDAEFVRLKSDAVPSFLLSKMHDDERLAPLLQTACRCLLHEGRFSEQWSGSVETDFKRPKMPPLHARLKLTSLRNDSEWHLCLRALQRDNASTFQARIRVAMTASGIDPNLPFRRLAVVRRGEIPTGRATDQLLNEFRSAGGLLLSPTDDELRTLHALEHLELRKLPDFPDWLRLRRPVSLLPMFEQLLAAAPAVDSA